MRINKVGILGMGAIGGLLAAQIYDYNSQSVYVLGEQERIKRYKDEGQIQVNGKDYHFTGLSPEDPQALDLIILSVNLDALNPEGMTSMLQDMRAKRKTEVEMFAGVVSKLGKKHEIPTPVNDMLYELIKAKEKINLIYYDSKEKVTEG